MGALSLIAGLINAGIMFLTVIYPALLRKNAKTKIIELNEEIRNLGLIGDSNSKLRIEAAAQKRDLEIEFLKSLRSAPGNSDTGA